MRAAVSSRWQEIRQGWATLRTLWDLVAGKGSTRLMVVQQGQVSQVDVHDTGLHQLARSAKYLAAGLIGTAALAVGAATYFSAERGLLYASVALKEREAEARAQEVAAAQVSLDRARDRDEAFRRYVSATSFLLNKDTELILSKLRSSGLQEREINRLLQQPERIGGLESRPAWVQHLADVASETLEQQLQFNSDLRNLVADMPTTTPLRESRITSGFGMRRHPLKGYLDHHTGVDLVSDSQREVRAAGAGVVTDTGWRIGYGNTVVVSHGRGFQTLYAHLESIGVKTGQRVGAGTPLGIVGSTGSSTGTHLHFELRLNERQLDPLKLLNAGNHVQQASAQ